LENLQWKKPVFPNDTLRMKHKVLESRPMRSKPDVGLVRTQWQMHNQHGECVLQMEGWGMFRRRHPGAELAKTDLLILDDRGLTPMNNEQRRDLLEILDDRCRLRSTLVSSQLPLEHWPEDLADPTLADAILDRLVHAAYTITLRGESMRKRTSTLTDEGVTQ
jgi:hypothetical protein